MALLAGGAFVLALTPGTQARPWSQPGISGFSPPAGVVGTAVTVTGRGFTGATTVTFNGVAAAFTVVDDADIQTSVPFGATTGRIAVTTPAGSAKSRASFRVQPVISGFSPGWGWDAMASGGTFVTISGSAFADVTAVTFHGVSASFTVDSYSQITATVPAGATTGRIRVTTKVGTATSSSPFDVLFATPGWAQFRYDATHGGTNPTETILSPGNVSALQLAWKDKIGRTGGEIGTSPAIADGIAYVVSEYPDSRLYAFDAVSGAPLWNTVLPGGNFASSPAVANGIVYAGSYDGTLYAFDTASGALRWSAEVAGPVTAPAVADGVVYATGNAKLYAFNAATGRRLWLAATGSTIFGSPAVANGIVYIGSSDFKFYAFDAANGAVLWTATTGNSVSSSPAVADGIVYVNSADSNFYAFNAASGSLLWKLSNGGLYGNAPAVAHGVVYLAVAGHQLDAIDAGTGALLWSAGTGNGYGSSAAVANGVVYVGTNDRNLYAFDADTGAQLWASTNTGNSLVTSPAVANGTVYIGSYHKLNAYRLPPAH